MLHFRPPADEDGDMDPARRPFDSLYAHGFARVAVCVPHVRVADPAFNVERTLALAREAAADTRRSACSPSWGSRPTPTTTCSTRTRCSTRPRRRSRGSSTASRDLLPGAASSARRCGSRAGCSTARSSSTAGGCSASCPRRYLPNYREFYEKRQFTRRRAALVGGEVRLLGQRRAVRQRPGLRGGRRRRASRCTSRSARTSGRRSRRARTARWPARRCWRTCRPATSPSARRTTAATSARRSRHSASRPTSTPPPAGRVDHRPGLGRPRADLRERRPAGRVGALRRPTSSCISADVDLDRLPPGPDAARPASATPSPTTASALARLPPGPRSSSACRDGRVPLRRPHRALPLRPARPARRATSAATRPTTSRSTASRQRLRATGIEKVVIGVSGGLDSTHALIVAAPRRWTASACRATNILGYTMPGFATSEHDARPTPGG